MLGTEPCGRHALCTELYLNLVATVFVTLAHNFSFPFPSVSLKNILYVHAAQCMQKLHVYLVQGGNGLGKKVFLTPPHNPLALLMTSTLNPGWTVGILFKHMGL